MGFRAGSHRPTAGLSTTRGPGPTRSPPTFRGASEAVTEAASPDTARGAGRRRGRAQHLSGPVERAGRVARLGSPKLPCPAGSHGADSSLCFLSPGVSAHSHCLCESRPGCRRTWGRGRDRTTGVGAGTAARPREGHHACSSRGLQSSRRTPRTQPFILSLLTLRPLNSDSLPQGPISLPVLTAPAGMD